MNKTRMNIDNLATEHAARQTGQVLRDFAGKSNFKMKDAIGKRLNAHIKTLSPR